MLDARLSAAGWGLGLLAVLLLLLHVVVLAIERPTGLPSGQLQPWWVQAAPTVGVLGVPVVGVLIVTRFPRAAYGWWWLGLSLAVGTVVGGVVAITRLITGGPVANWVGGLVLSWAYVGVLLCLVQVLLLFPDSRPPSRRWRWVARLALWCAIAGTVAVTVAPVPQGESPSPIAVDGVLGTVALGIWYAGTTGLLVLVLVSTAAVPWRWRGAGPAQRRQLKWFAWGTAWFAPAFIVAAFFDDFFPAWVNAVLVATQFVALQVAVGFAMLRHGLYDVDRVINRTLLYVVVSACLIAAYLGVVVVTSVFLAGHLVGVPQAVATATVALLVLPVRSRVQKAVDRVTFGARGDPYAVLTQLGHHLQTAGDPEAVLVGIVRSVALTLRLPYAAIALRRGQDVLPAASYGVEPSNLVGFPLTYQGDQVGVLLAAPRSAREDLTSTDRRLLSDLARHAGVAAYAYLLTDDLRRSRARVLAAREEERRRLRRNLHDGLGPTLAAVALGLETARRRLDDPSRAGSMLTRLGMDLQGAIEEVRRLAHDLRPPALDQFGLLEAIRVEARRFETEAAATPQDTTPQPTRTQVGSTAHGLSIDLQAPAVAPQLPAAVEVAAYRIIGEALTNVVRHSGARHCVVRLRFDEHLHIEITDDGTGLAPKHRRGVGLTSMVERATEVGGRCDISTCAGLDIDAGTSPDIHSVRHGTKITVHLPLEAPT
ncbi:sensor histidine kinase [Kineococcus sp. SYSU DK005]|uniref:sensor histidine kinase n=1 Tax=Kineococcus sp. SYSU DK005 TaxID=3383126 RepID=UPI003D7DBFB2